jgi:threonine/homoserine/homoserine lactone efflux protein
MNSDFWPLVGFSVAMTITPGPNNLMVAAAAANHGITDTVPHITGIAVGFTLMLAIVAAGLGGVVMGVPLLHPVMQWVGAVWLLYIAWKIATALPPALDGEKRPPLGFFGAALFQWVNPKAWMIALGAASEFVVPGRPLALEAGRIAGVFAIVAIPCILPWAMLGSGTARILNAPHRLRMFNVAMAVLLVISVVPMLLR